MSFDEVAHDIDTETAVRLGKRQVEQIVYDAAQDFDAFYAQPCAPVLQQYAQAKPMQVLTFDSKGVVMRREALREATRKKVEARAQQAPRGFARQDKSNRKRMATAAGIYHIDRHSRSPHTVARRFALDDPQAAPWVAEQIERLLHGQVRPLVRSLRRWATVQGLSPKQREPIDQCATYLANHVPYLNYPDYLAKGYPIATGVIEGACRYLVKDRMDLTGARWGLEGGEAVLKLRALVINGDCDAYWTFHETQEYQRNHQATFAEMPPARAHLKLVSGGKNG